MLRGKSLLLIPWFISILFFINTGLSYSQIIINEVCASNSDNPSDVEGDFEDWVELVNTGIDPVNLSGYCLGDAPELPASWCFPEYIIQPGEHLLVFASGKDISSPPTYWQSIIELGDTFRYILPDKNTPTTWRNVSFDDTGWQTGSTGIGYGDDDDATLVSTTLSVFLRRSFQLDDPSMLTGLALHMDFDDGFVAYLNGAEVARSGVSGEPPAYDTPASEGREASIYQGGEPLLFDLTDHTDLLLRGENVLAVQVHNLSEGSSDLSIIPFLSFQSSEKSLDAPLRIWNLRNNYFHTSFKLDADGDSLYLWNPEAELLDSFSFVYLGANHSYGRSISRPDDWVIFEKTTPGEQNYTPHYQGYVGDLPMFSAPGGRFSEPFHLSLSTAKPGDSIYYSLDGALPSQGSLRYSVPIEVSSDMIIKARIIRTGYLPGATISKTFFSGTDNHLPVVSISTDQYHLWDYHEGIYVKGPNAESDFPYFGSNFWKDWERPAHIEAYDENGNPAFNLDAGIKIYGGYTRGHPQKSMAIFARKKYGAGKIEFPLFEEKPISEFEALVIRNSGNDWFGEGRESGTMFRDLLMTRLTRNMDVEYLAGRPAVIYINGEYWGIQNIREKINEHFLASNKGVDPESVTLLEGEQSPIIGDNTHYSSMISFLQLNDISQKENYDHVKSLMDIQNFINYQVVQIYYNNTDWPGNNIKYWRPDTPNGKWRWILYDTDFGFGMWDLNKVNNNTLEFATDTNGPSWPNPPWSTYLLRRLLQNQEFKELFVNSFADQINTSFRPESVVELISELKDAIDQEMYKHAERWGGSYRNWSNRVDNLEHFAKMRPEIMKSHIKISLDLQSKQQLHLEVSDNSAGFIRLNTVNIKDFPWEGTYYQGIPVNVTAVPMPGYRFSAWTGALASDKPNISLDLSSSSTLTAHFEPDNSNGESPLVINEICYKQDAFSDSEDWVELYNRSDQYVDLSAWVLKDADDLHSYQFKSGSLLKPGGFHVVCRNLAAFETVYPSVGRYEGEMNFGLSSNGDWVRLYNNMLELVDSVSYGIYQPWPVIPDGSGYTLALADPESDNSLPESWQLSGEPMGTPGGNNANALGTQAPSDLKPGDVLYQNSPNPFSTSTRIEFYSANRQPVRITIYDLKGQLVAVLANGMLEAGIHKFEWTPQAGLSGVFILRAETPGTVQTKKLIKHR